MKLVLRRPASATPVRHLADVHHAIVSCERCPRLRAYCRLVAQEKKRAHQGEAYWGKPVPGFGDPTARLLLVALAPAAHGANRTGRVFTGDGVGGSGDFLMAALHRAGFANIPTSRAIDDGLVLHDAFITSAARCAPPDNKPHPAELARCAEHLDAEVARLTKVRVVIGLGKIAFDAWLARARRLGAIVSPKPAFGHGVVVKMGRAKMRPDGDRHSPAGTALPILVGCFHPSRQNTNTGRLTADMMDAVIRTAKKMLDRP
jgi:uracil-DNA glycosylase family 4